MGAQTSIMRAAAEVLARFFARHPALFVGFLLVYVVSPIDLFPEAIAGLFGYLDDVLLVTFALLLRRYGMRLNKQSPTPSRPSIDTTAE